MTEHFCQDKESGDYIGVCELSMQFCSFHHHFKRNSIAFYYRS